MNLIYLITFLLVQCGPGVQSQSNQWFNRQIEPYQYMNTRPEESIGSSQSLQNSLDQPSHRHRLRNQGVQTSATHRLRLHEQPAAQAIRNGVGGGYRSPTRHHRPRYVAKPGNVIVHFNRDHQIQRIQYVLQNGALATLYHRPTDGSGPIQIPHPDTQRRRSMGPSDDNEDTEVDDEQSDVNSSNSDIDHEQTIDVLNSKLQGVSQLVGNHLTIPISSHSLGKLSKDALNHLTGLQKQQQTNKNLTHENDEKLDVIATVAVDMLEAGASAGSKKAKKLSKLVIDKLKKKVNMKLKEVPDIVAKKLSQNSSNGQIFIDRDPKGHSMVLGFTGNSAQIKHKHKFAHHPVQQTDQSKFQAQFESSNQNEAQTENKPISVGSHPNLPARPASAQNAGPQLNKPEPVSALEASPNVSPVNEVDEDDLDESFGEIIDNDDGYMDNQSPSPSSSSDAISTSAGRAENNRREELNGAMLASLRRPLSSMASISPSIPLPHRARFHSTPSNQDRS